MFLNHPQADVKLNIINDNQNGNNSKENNKNSNSSSDSNYSSSHDITNSGTTAVDLNKLAYAVAMAETKDCTLGAGKYLNCHGIMHWPNGKRQLRRFNSKEESYAAFKELWQRVYKRYPDYSLAKLYTGNDRPDNWLRIVNYYYNQ